jgi:chromosomal replication initiator protein
VHEELEPIWSPVRDELRRKAPDLEYHIWLEPLRPAGIRGTTLYVRAPEHIRSWVGTRYLGLLQDAAHSGWNGRATVEVVGEDWVPPSTSTSATAPGAPSHETALNPRYTFEQFVIGGGNRFAHAAALAVAELPGQAYNPLFIHGEPGLGKTHLLHAIGNYLGRFGAGLRVRYATVEEFTTEFVSALRERRTDDFKRGFRSADVVLIDDVQFLARKETTREEFFHMFNALHESGRQLVMTSDRPPDEVPDLEERLAQRFQSGLVVELDPPSLELRQGILQKRARTDGVQADPDVLDEIAHAVTSSVRALEGALIRVVAYASLKGEAPTVGLARRVLYRLGDKPPGVPCSVHEIVDATAREFGVRRESVLARDRRPDVATARKVAMYLARELTNHSLPEIGRSVGGRNHTTVLHAVNRVAVAVQTDETIARSVEKLRRRLARPT